MRIVFLHGLESGPHGSKYRALVDAFDQVTAPDCTGVQSIWDRLSIIQEHMGTDPAIIVGSSFGGLAAVLLSKQRPDLVAGMVLCAPALGRPEAGDIGCPLVDTIIIHGTQDVVVPIASSRDYALADGVSLIEVADDHYLAASVDLIVTQVQHLHSRLTQA